MRKYNLFILLLIAFSETPKVCAAQNLKETYQWIKIAVESNTYSFVTLSADSSQLIIAEEPWGKNPLGVRQTIALKKIQSAQFVNDGDIVRLELKCTSEKCVKIELKGKNHEEWNSASNSIFVSILFKSGTKDDIKRRIEKAFNHLIVIQGGVTLDNKF